MAQAAIFGLNTGLDTAGIIDNLVLLRKRATDIVLAKRELEQAKLASLQELKSRLQTFKSITFDISKESRFLSVKGNFANNSSTDNNQVVDISTNSLASSGSFTLTVLSLAKEGKVVSEGVNAITDAVPTGTLEITVGNTITLIQISSSNNTLDGLKQAINNAGANVDAAFLNDGSDVNPFRLVVSGNKTGTENAVSIRMFQSTIGGGPISTFDFNESQTAQNATLIVDGIPVTKSSNVITDVIAGTTLTLKSAGSGAITLQSDISSIKDKVLSFVNGFNDLTSFIRQQTFLDSDTNTSGLLVGNFTTQNLQQTLRRVVTGSVAGTAGTFRFLSQIGIKTAPDGLLELDQSKLTEAITQDAGSVSQLFASKGTTSNTNVTFVGFTEDTRAGVYDIRVFDGVAQLSLSGKNNFTDTTGSGSLFAGADGTSAKGLNFVVPTTLNRSFGTITLSLGVGEILSRAVANLTDFSRGGPLKSDIDTSTSTIKDLEKTAEAQEKRLVQFEDNLRSRFVNLEIIVGRLNVQRDAFASTFEGLKNLFKK